MEGLIGQLEEKWRFVSLAWIFLRFSSLAQVKLLRIYLTGPTSQICSEFFFLGERGAQSGLIGEFLVKNGDFFTFSSLFKHFRPHIPFQGLKTINYYEMKYV